MKPRAIPCQSGWSAVVPLLLFVAILGTKYAIVFSCPVSGKLNGDEQDYVHKARAVWETGSLPRAKEVGEGELAYSDFRPPGYPLLVAPLLVFGHEARQVHVTIRVVQSVLDIGTTCFVFWLCCQLCASLPYRVVVAIALGVQPWTSAYVMCALTETVVTFLIVAGVAALSRFVTAGASGRRNVWLLTGSALLSATFLCRPEMIVFVPAMVALAVALRRPGWKRFLALGALASIPFLACVLGLVAHRYHVAREWRIYGRFRHASPGLRKWSCTWNAPDQIKSAVVWGTRRGEDTFPLLPDGAFDSKAERAQVRAILQGVHQAGRMAPADDDALMNLAEQRIGRSPWRYYCSVRVYESAHLWINLESSAAYCHFFSRLPRLVSKAAVGAFLLLRIVVLGFALAGAFRLWKGWRSQSRVWTGCFMLLGLFFIVTRTLFFGWYCIIAESRYVAPAWPFVLVLAAYGTQGAFERMAARRAGQIGSPDDLPQQEYAR